ncbi:MAG: lamin tail domain-containing protein [Roseiflexaceae bacterium]|nr:lamin tail domain-containing protein [Roseiflexaceae bacterium]
MEPLLLQSIPVPFSAYALCFIPLATVIVGLLAFFVLTDRHSNRPYLRYNAFRAVATPAAAQAAPSPAAGETPAGSLGGAEGGTTTVYGGGGEIGAVAEVANTGSPAVKKATVAAVAQQEQATVVATGEGIATRQQANQEASLHPAAADAAARPMVDEIVGAAAGGHQGIASAGSADASGLRIAEVMHNPEGSDVAGEFVRIVNQSGQEIDLTGWTLRDEGRKHLYMFPAFVLPAGAEIKIWSRTGSDDPRNLFWNNASAIWNNTSDTVVLEDLTGTVVGRLTYQGE